MWRRIVFAGGVIAAWFFIALASSIPTPADGTTAEAIGPHFIAWVMLTIGASIAVAVPEWRRADTSWQKIIFYLAVALVIGDTTFHYVVFGRMRESYGQLGAGARAFPTITYFLGAIVLLAGAAALLTQFCYRNESGAV